jgi:hypothetical protein
MSPPNSNPPPVLIKDVIAALWENFHDVFPVTTEIA